MPITFSDPPQSALEAARSGMRTIVSRRRFGDPALRAADPDALELDTPLGVSVLGAEDLTNGRGLDAARAVGWRYIIRAGHEPIATADAATDNRGSHSFSHINQGPYVKATAEAVAAAADLPETHDGTFEARLLEIPALHSTSLWLHATDEAGGDMIVPIAPTPPELDGRRPYQAATFLRILEQQATMIGPDQGPTGDHES